MFCSKGFILQNEEVRFEFGKVYYHYYGAIRKSVCFICLGTQKIYVKTWGCSHNNSDSEYMAGQLAAYGYEITGQFCQTE